MMKVKEIWNDECVKQMANKPAGANPGYTWLEQRVQNFLNRKIMQDSLKIDWPVSTAHHVFRYWV